VTGYSRLNPFPAPLVLNRLLSGKGSSKEVRQIAFDLAGSGMEYRVGQSLGVCPSNAPENVDALLRAAGFGGQEQVTLPKAIAPVSLREALLKEFHLGAPSPKIVDALAAAAQEPVQKARLEELLRPESAAQLTQFLSERFFVVLFEEFPSARIQPQQLVDGMKKLQPRLYSIASSPKTVGTLVELTVGIVRYATNGHNRDGVCSTFLADRLPLNEKAPIFVCDSPFKLTDDDSAPIIMVGPGTGIAPFRAFLQERAARKASGKAWLFFGDQHRGHDFLYEEELTGALKQGVLTRLDLAWSRDQEEKVYVQDLMRKNAAELWKWLQDGAYFYVCGDAKKMAKDVDAALAEVVSRQGGMDGAQTLEYLSALRKSGRYMRDVY
jgi:sulfite reductase (NADPH) flavoprotein alpha-component